MRRRLAHVANASVVSAAIAPRLYAVSPAEPARAPSGMQIQPWKWHDSTSSHPGYGASPALVNSVFRQAEAGYLGAQCDLFDDLIESDGHLRSLIEGRIGAVAGREWVIQPGSQDSRSIKAAEALERVLRDSLNFHDFIEHQLTANYYGFAASEIDWQDRDGDIVPAWFANAPHTRFVFDPFNNLRLLTPAAQDHGVELQPGKWVVTRRPHKNLARAGLMRTLAWWAVFKRMSVRDWIVFAEKFGIPNVIGEYRDNATTEAIQALEKAIRDIGEAGQAVLPESTKIAFTDAVQRSGDNSGLHPAVVALCESQMSKLINGSTLTSDSGGPGSFALGKVHESRQFSLEVADATRLSHVFRQHIGVPFLRFNGMAGAAAPRLKVQVMQELDAKTRAEVASLVVNDLGAEIDGAQLLDELGFRRPSRAEDALRGRVTPSEPGTERDAKSLPSAPKPKSPAPAEE